MSPRRLSFVFVPKGLGLPALKGRRLLALLLASLSLPALSAPVLYDGIAAVVGEEVILLSEVEEMRQGLDPRLGLARLPMAQQRRQILDQLIDEKVMLVKAKQDTTLKVVDKDVSPRVDDYFGRVAEQQGGEKKLEALLKQTNGMTLSEYRGKLSQRVRDDLYKQKLQMKYAGETEPTPLQVQEFYRQYRDSLPVMRNSLRISHLQVRIKANEALERTARAEAESLIRRLDRGEAFVDLAKAHSDDLSGKEGGDIGLSKKGVLDPDYEKAAFALEPGQYTRTPARSRYGYHVIKLTGRKDNEVRTSHILVLVKPDAQDTLKTRAFTDSLRGAVLAGGKASAGAATGSAAAPASPAARFQDLARRFSDDRKTREKGGDLGWFAKEQLEEAYAAAVDTLKEGEVSAPVLIGDAFHLFRLDQKADERRLTLEDDWTQIQQFARNIALQKKLKTYVDKWRRTVNVERREDLLARMGEAPEAEAGEGAQ